MSDETNPQTPEEENAPEKNKKFQTLRGFQDFLPDDHDYFTLIKKSVRHRGRQSGFRRITTPAMEETGLFARGLGDETDVVSKEMFTMESRSGKSMTLKPEGTAGIVRSYIEHGMQSLPQPVQFYYIEPHFRYDRPQKGRFRQFHQYGFEVLGERDPSIDAQVIHMNWKILQDLKIDNRLDIQLNTLGTPEVRDNYSEALKDFFFDKVRHLSEESKRRLEKNPLRILDSKDEDDQILVSMAPKMKDFLDSESKEFYECVKSYLKELNIPFYENESLVRGLDYYCDTVFEVWDRSLGSQNAVGGGGRYDPLGALLGSGNPIPAMGCAFGVERVMGHMMDAKVEVRSKDSVDVFVAQLGEEAKKKAIKIATELRDLGVHAIGGMGKASMKAQLKMADKREAPWCIILGEVEVREGVAIIRDMKIGKQFKVPIENLNDEVLNLIGKENLDTYELGE
jgi:histidyl-tRNA synthetase